MLLGTCVCFTSPFLHLDDEHGTWSTCLFQVTYLSFCIFCILPQASYMFIWCGFIPNVIWRFSNNISSTRCKELALNRKNFLYVRCNHSFYLLVGQVYRGMACVSLSLLVCLHIHWYPHKSVGTSICLLLLLYTSNILSLHPWEHQLSSDHHLGSTHVGAWEHQVVDFLLQAGYFHIRCMFRHAKWCI